MDQKTRQLLSDLLKPIDLLCSRVVMRNTANIQEVKVSFLNSWKFLNVNYFSPGSPLQFYLGLNIPVEAVVLTGNPASYSNMVSKDHIGISTQEMALEFAKTFLETTRSNSFTFYLVNSVDDIDFLPTSTETIQDEINGLKKSLSDLVKPPFVTFADQKYLVTLYAVMGLDLVLFEVTVLPMGTIVMRKNEIQKNMPICRTV